MEDRCHGVQVVAKSALQYDRERGDAEGCAELLDDPDCAGRLWYLVVPDCAVWGGEAANERGAGAEAALARPAVDSKSAAGDVSRGRP